MKESKTRQVQLVQRDSLVNALKLKAGSDGISMNEAGNRAIEEYLKTGGDNIVEEQNRRIMFILPQSMYNQLSETAKAQGLSINKAVDHALTAYVTGKQTDNTNNRLVTYISISGNLRSRVKEMSTAVNMCGGAVRSIMDKISALRSKKVPKSKEKDRYEEVLTEVDRLWKTVSAMVDQVNEINSGPEVPLK